MDGLRFNVFGRLFLIRRGGDLWEAYALGADGKHSPAGFVVPDFVEEGDLEQYLYDLFHERSTPRNGDVRRLP